MYKCEYFSKCGDYNRHECSHYGNTLDGQRAYCCNLKLNLRLLAEMDVEEWADLERKAETIDDEIEALEEAVRPTAELMRWEVTV